MTASSWALQSSIFQALANSPELTSLLGGERIYSNPPPAAQFPFITLGQTVNLDWSTGTEDGTEHSLTLHVWSRGGGRKEAVEIMAAARAVLHEAALSLSGFRLVNLRHEVSEARRDPDGETYHGIVRFRAVTEPE